MRELSLNILDVAQNSITAGASLITIEVNENTVDHTLLIGIYDNGKGMSEEQVRSVIDPFFTTRTTRKVGMGIPLFKMAAEQTGGKLEIKSELGVGTEVRAYFKTDSGVLFSAKNSTRAKLDNTCRIFGSKGYVEIPEYWKARKAIFHTDAGEETIHIPCQHELIYEVQHIAECFEKGLLTSYVVTEELSCKGIAALEQVKENW